MIQKMNTWNVKPSTKKLIIAYQLSLSKRLGKKLSQDDVAISLLKGGGI